MQLHLPELEYGLLEGCERDEGLYKDTVGAQTLKSRM